MPEISRLTKRTQATKMVEGLTKRFPKRASFLLHGEHVSTRAILALCQSHIEALDAADAARRALAVANERKIGARVATIKVRLRAAIQLEFGPKSELFAAFGWTPPKKPGPKTVASKVAGMEKRRKKAKA